MPNWAPQLGVLYQEDDLPECLASKVSVACFHRIQRASLVAQTVKNPLAMQETWVRSPGWEDTLEEGMATHSSIENPHGQRSLAGYSPWGCKESDMTEQLSTEDCRKQRLSS